MKRLNSCLSKGCRVDLPSVLNSLGACILISVFISGSCRLETPNEVVIDNKVDIYYVNSKNEDLLDTAIVGSFREDSIHLYNVENGVKTEVNNRVDYPHNFVIYQNEGLRKYVLRVFLETDTTYLELNSRITDTITCLFDITDNNFIIRKVWYNGSVKWEDYAVFREFTIMK